MYGKLDENQKLELIDGTVIELDGFIIANPSVETLLKHGYKKIVEEPFPDAEYKMFKMFYEEVPDTIYIKYKEVKP